MSESKLREKLDATCTPESFADLIRQRSDLMRQLERSQGAEADCAKLVRERDDLRTKVADLESLNRMVGYAADANEKDAIQAHDRITALMKERDELREALQAAMLDCDHLILKWPSNPYEWQIGVSKIQEKLRAILAGGRVT